MHNKKESDILSESIEYPNLMLPEDIFATILYEMLKLDINGNELTGGNFTTLCIKYHILNYGGPLVNISYRERLAELFISQFM